MKSTGEVLGIGRTLSEALFKGMTASGRNFKYPHKDGSVGVLLSVDTHDLLEVVSLAKKLDDLKFSIYATPETAEAVRSLGIDVTEVTFKDFVPLLDDGKISYVLYTGALLDGTLDEYIALNRRCLQLSVPCFTSLDTAHAAADIIAGGFNESNTELVDINKLREEKQKIDFFKMQATGDDYIIIDGRDGNIDCPESISIGICDRHFGIGADGLALIEKSEVADAKMRVFNRDGSEGSMGGNCIRSVGKYLYDHGIVPKTDITIETSSGIKNLTLYTRNGKVTLADVNIGKADLTAASVPVITDKDKLINSPITVAGNEYNVTCVSVGNPHCVVFCDSVDAVDLATVGPQFENAPIFPERVNTEFVRVVNPTMLKIRVWERGSGETLACGTGACAAVVAAVENGYCKKGEDITVKVRGGDLTVNYGEDGIILTGDTKLVYEGSIYY